MNDVDKRLFRNRPCDSIPGHIVVLFERCYDRLSISDLECNHDVDVASHTGFRVVVQSKRTGKHVLKSRAGQFAYHVAEHSYFIYHNEQRLYTLLGNSRHSAAPKFDRKHRIEAISAIDYDSSHQRSPQSPVVAGGRKRRGGRNRWKSQRKNLVSQKNRGW